MEDKIIGVRELQRNLRVISNQALRGRSFMVVRNTKPLFRIEPPRSPLKNARHTLADFKKIQFRSGNPNLSQKIDKILYGRK